MSPNTSKRPAASPTRRRMHAAAVVTVLFGLLLIVANHAGWLATTVLDTGTFVDTLAPLPADPDVSRALGESLADNVIESNEVGKAITDALPDGLEFAAAPLTRSLRDLIADIATKIIRSDRFGVIWEKTLELTHRVTLLYLRGAESDLITSEGGYVVLDLTAMGDLVSDELDELGFTALDGVELDLTIELFEVDDGGIIGTLASIIYSIRWFSIALTAALLLTAYAVATDRRRLTVWVGGATAIAMAVSLIDGRLLKALVGSGVEDPVREAGIVAAENIVFARFVTQSWIILLVGVIVAVFAWLMGNTAGAQSVKKMLSGVARGGASGGTDASLVSTFVARHRRLLEWGTIALIAGFLLLAPLPSFTVVLASFAAAILLIASIEYLAFTAARPNTDDGAAHDSE